MTQTYRLYEYFLPKHYDLHLTLEREARLFHGEVTISGHKPTAAHHVLVHGKDLTFHSVTIGGELVHVTPMAHDAHRLDADLPAGDYDITIKFSGTITDPMHGMYPCYYEQDGVKKELLVTQFESHHAREVFPCIDEPEAKATFDLTLTTEAGITALSNMPIKRGQIAEGRLQNKFETTPRMSTYLLAFVVGEFHHTTGTSKNGTEVSIYSTLAHDESTHAFALREAIDLLDNYEEYFGVDYPLPKCDHIALPDFSSLAMENWGLITYREGYLLTSSNTPIEQRHYIATVIAHELAHQWFGNHVTMRWWDDLWLNESFANLMQYMMLDRLHPEWELWDDFTSKESVLALSRDEFASIQPIKYHVRSPDDIAAVFDKAILYAKGSRLIRMAIAYVGEDAFRQALKNYFTTFAYGNTDGHDLWHAMHEASGKHIEALMDVWLRQSGFPVVSVTTHDGSYSLAQHRFSLGEHEPTDTLWPVPLAAADDRFPVLLHERADRDIAADSPHLNANGVSHFITHYDDASFADIVRELDDGHLSATERSLFLYETFLLTQSGHYTSAQLLSLLPHFSRETSSAVWLVISMIADGLRLATANKNAANLDTFIQSIAVPASKLMPLDDDSRLTDNERKSRGLVAEILIRHHHTETIQVALGIYRGHDDLASIDGNLQSAAFLAAARSGTQKDMLRLIHLHNTTGDGHLRDLASRALAASQNHSTLTAFINALDDPDTVKPQDLPFWFYYLMSNPVSQEATWQWAHDHWSWLVEHFGNGHALEKFPIYAAKTLHGKEWLARYTDFFVTHDDPTIRRAAQVGQDEIAARTAWVARDGHTLFSDGQ